MGIRHEEQMLVDAGHKPAVWTSELDQESNSGAHMNSESFVKNDGKYTSLEDKSVPMQRDITTPWATADAKLGADVAFNAKEDN